MPAELVVWVDQGSQKEQWYEEQKQLAIAENRITAAEDPESDPTFEYDKLEYDLKYSMLERAELSQRVRQQLERFFGPEGMAIIGTGMSTDVFAPLHLIDSKSSILERNLFNTSLVSKRPEMVKEDYLAVGGVSNVDRQDALNDQLDPTKDGLEMWRISIRLKALNDVDYGQFISDMKSVVEPTLTAYRKRTEILKKIHEIKGEDLSLIHI